MEFLFSLIVGLVVIGLLLWLLSLIPIDPTILQVIRVVVIVFVVLWLVSILLGFAPSMPFPAFRR